MYTTLQTMSSDLQKVIEAKRQQNLSNLKALVTRGASIKHCYDNFPKSFVDQHYHALKPATNGND